MYAKMTSTRIIVHWRAPDPRITVGWREREWDVSSLSEKALFSWTQKNFGSEE